MKTTRWAARSTGTAEKRGKIAACQTSPPSNEKNPAPAANRTPGFPKRWGLANPVFKLSSTPHLTGPFVVPDFAYQVREED